MRKLIYFLLILVTSGCKEKYEAPIVSPDTGYLVIEGIINSGQGNTVLTLSRTTKLDDRTPRYEQGAQVTVQGEDNSFFALQQTGPGQYSAIALNLNPARKYRLTIRTSDGKEYLSEYAEVLKTPSVDSVSWKREDGGVTLNVHSRDPLNKTRYYQWQYDESWEIRSDFRSSIKYKVTKGPSSDEIFSIAFRDSTTFSYDESIYTCWQFNSSTSLQLGSTARLSQDIVDLPIAFVPPASRKLSVLYSINVKQYAWTKAGYEFLERMKKNTESTGSIFDAQPSELRGNIYCVSDPSEPVIGFVNFSTIEEKRIFIRKDQVPDWRYNSGCMEIRVDNNSDSIKNNARFLMPTQPIFQLGGTIFTFGAAPPECVDCTLNGTNRKPNYWP
jgi:Domain of unknown function (DUF4249)